MSHLRKFFCVATAAALVTASAGSACAGAREFLTSSRLYGILGLGATTYFGYEAYSARQDANDFYDRYQAAGRAAVARDLYDESRRMDTRSAVLMAVGVGTLGISIHLLLSGDDGDDLDVARSEGVMEVRGLALDVGGDPMRQELKVGVRKSF